MEYNSSGLLIQTYNVSTLNLGASPVFAIDLSDNGKFYYVDVCGTIREGALLVLFAFLLFIFLPFCF